MAWGQKMLPKAVFTPLNIQTILSLFVILSAYINIHSDPNLFLPPSPPSDGQDTLECPSTPAITSWKVTPPLRHESPSPLISGTDISPALLIFTSLLGTLLFFPS